MDFNLFIAIETNPFYLCYILSGYLWQLQKWNRSPELFELYIMPAFSQLVIYWLFLKEKLISRIRGSFKRDGKWNGEREIRTNVKDVWEDKEEEQMS